MGKYIYLLFAFLSISPFALSAYSAPLSDAQVNDLLSSGLIVNSKDTESQVVNKLGKPQRVKVEKVTNKYSGTKDVVARHFYNGLEITFYECNNPEGRWKNIVRIEISSNKYILKYGISVGMKLEDVFDLLKNREYYMFDSYGMKHYAYQQPDSVHDQIIFAVKDGVVRQVIWSNEP